MTRQAFILGLAVWGGLLVTNCGLLVLAWPEHRREFLRLLKALTLMPLPLMAWVDLAGRHQRLSGPVWLVSLGCWASVLNIALRLRATRRRRSLESRGGRDV